MGTYDKEGSCPVTHHCSGRYMTAKWVHGACVCVETSKRELAVETLIGTSASELNDDSQIIDTNNKRAMSLEPAQPVEKRDLWGNPAFTKCHSTHHCSKNQISVMEGGPHGKRLCWNVLHGDCPSKIHCKNNQIAVKGGPKGACVCWNVPGWHKRAISAKSTPPELDDGLKTSVANEKRDLWGNPAFAKTIPLITSQTIRWL